MFWCGLLLAFFGAFNATFAQDGPKAIDEVFEKQVRPLLISKCYECHSQSTEQNGGLSMDSLEGMLKGGDSRSDRRIAREQPDPSRDPLPRSEIADAA